MNRQRMLISTALAAGVCFFLASVAPAQTINLFDDAVEVDDWRYDFGLSSADLTLSYDAAMDAAGSATSGAMRVDINFSTASGDNKMAITNDFFGSETDISGAPRIELDLFVDSASAQDAFGNYGWIEMVVRNTDGYSWTSGPGMNLGPAGQWIHWSIPMGDYSSPPDAARAFTLQLYGGPSQNIDGALTYWLDNVAITPEPTSFVLLGCAIVVVCLSRVRRRRVA